MTMYGYQSPDYASIETAGYYTGTVSQPSPKFVTDSSLSPGQYILSDSGYYGYTASAYRIWYDGEGNQIKYEDLPSSYYSPTAPTYRVGPGTITSQIPMGSSSGTVGAEGQEPDPPESSSASESSEPASSQPSSSVSQPDDLPSS